MMMNEEETKWIRSNYKTCPLYAAIAKLVVGVSGMDGAPAEHPSLLFYLVVNAIDDIKCASTKQRRLDKCKEMKDRLVFYLKNKRYDQPNNLAAEILICVKSALLLCSELEYLQEMDLIYHHIYELVNGDDVHYNRLREYAMTYFRGDELEVWLKDYIKSKVFVSEDIVKNVTEISKKSVVAPVGAKSKGKGNRNKELFSDKEEETRMKSKLIAVFSENDLRKNNIGCTNSDTEILVIGDFYNWMRAKGYIEKYSNSRGYYRFLTEICGFGFSRSESRVLQKLADMMENKEKQRKTFNFDVINMI